MVTPRECFTPGGLSAVELWKKSQDLLGNCELGLRRKSEEGNVPWLKGRGQKKLKGWGNRKGFIVDIILQSWF